MSTIHEQFLSFGWAKTRSDSGRNFCFHGLASTDPEEYL